MLNQSPSIFARLKAQPKEIFLLDSIGAFVTGFVLLVMARFPDVFGLPYPAVCVLCSIAFVFCLYSFCCYYFSGKIMPPLLLLIIAGNSLYALLTASLVVYHFRSITGLGLAYFVAELIVLGMLVALEVNVLKRKQDF